MSYPTPMDVAEAEDREAMTDPFADELAKCSVLYTENLVAEREALIAEIAKEREAHIDDVARLRRQVDEAVECCIIKDNRNLRLEAELTALKRAAWDVHDTVSAMLDNNEAEDSKAIRKVLDELGELIPAQRPGRWA